MGPLYTHDEQLRPVKLTATRALMPEVWLAHLGEAWEESGKVNTKEAASLGSKAKLSWWCRNCEDNSPTL